MRTWHFLVIILFGFAFANLWAWTWFSPPIPKATFDCTVIITDGAPSRLRSTAYEGVGHMTGDTIVCRIK